jgi:hypothetical protein
LPDLTLLKGHQLRIKTKMKRLRLAICMTVVTGCMSVNAALLLDRGLPTANLNNAAGADRANVAWAFTQYTSPDYWVVGDTFKNTSSEAWAIDSIRLWTVGQTDTAILRGGVEGGSMGIISSSYSIADVTYAGGVMYQGSSGSSIGMHQVDFAVNITLAPGQMFSFFLDGSGSGDGTFVPFAHASNAALSGSAQDGADDLMLYAEVLNGILDSSSVGSWTSLGDGWDKASDLNVQVFGSPVPEPTTILAGALLLLPFGVSTIRILRRNRSA